MDIKVVPAQFIKDNLDDIVVIDVRAPEEGDADGRIPGSFNIPSDTLEERLDEIPRNKTVYMHCRTGGRSGRATELLVSKGYDAVNIAGGIFAWNAINIKK